MIASILQDHGDKLAYDTTEALAGGDVVVVGDYQSSFIGINQSAAAANSRATLQVRGVATMPKEPGVAVSRGQWLYWDSVEQFVSTNGDWLTCAGRCTEDAAANDTTVKLFLTPDAVPSSELPTQRQMALDSMDLSQMTFAYGAEFVAADSRSMSVAADSDFDFTGGKVTIAFERNPTTLTTDMAYLGHIQHNTANGGGFCVSTGPNSTGPNSVTLWISTNSGSSAYCQYITPQASAELFRRYSKITIRFDGSKTDNVSGVLDEDNDKCVIYLDDVPQILTVTGTQPTAFLYPSTKALHVGQFLGLGRYYNGVMRHLRVWKGALTKEEILQNYNNGESPSHIELGALNDSRLVLSYDMQEDGGTRKDYKNAHDLTPSAAIARGVMVKTMTDPASGLVFTNEFCCLPRYVRDIGGAGVHGIRCGLYTTTLNNTNTALQHFLQATFDDDAWPTYAIDGDWLVAFRIGVPTVSSETFIGPFMSDGKNNNVNRYFGMMLYDRDSVALDDMRLRYRQDSSPDAGVQILQPRGLGTQGNVNVLTNMRNKGVHSGSDDWEMRINGVDRPWLNFGVTDNYYLGNVTPKNTLCIGALVRTIDGAKQVDCEGDYYFFGCVVAGPKYSDGQNRAAEAWMMDRYAVATL